MIKRYSTDEIDLIKDFFVKDEFEYVVLASSLLSENLLYFDIWLSVDNLGICAVIFRSYGNFYLKYNERANVEEISSFISFMPMLDTLCLRPSDFDDVACMLKGIRKVSTIKISKQTDPTKLQKHDLYYQITADTSNYRGVYSLIKKSGFQPLLPFDDYYFLRKGFDKNKTGRSYYLESDGRVYTTASTTGEVETLALVTDVVTDVEFARRGLASAVISKLCLDLAKENRTAIITYSDPTIQGLYEKLGFTKIGDRIIAHFK